MKNIFTLFAFFTLASCSPLNEGKVISKTIDPANTYRTEDYTKMSGLTIITEKDTFDDLDYVLSIEPVDGSEPFEVEVDSLKWYNTNVGDYYKENL